MLLLFLVFAWQDWITCCCYSYTGYSYILTCLLDTFPCPQYLGGATFIHPAVMDYLLELVVTLYIVTLLRIVHAYGIYFALLLLCRKSYDTYCCILLLLCWYIVVVVTVFVMERTASIECYILLLLFYAVVTGCCWVVVTDIVRCDDLLVLLLIFVIVVRVISMILLFVLLLYTIVLDRIVDIHCYYCVIVLLYSVDYW